VSVDLIPVARLTGIFGLRGELKCRPTSAGEGAVEAGREYPLGAEPGAKRVTLQSVRKHSGRLVVLLRGVATPEAAQTYVGRELYAERGAIELAPGEYLDADLVGMQIVDEAGTVLGEVVGVEHYPAQDCLVVGKQRALVPLVKAFVREIDLPGRKIVMDLPEGLL
jgi:16S rRNA processing protein RimM